MSEYYGWGDAPLNAPYNEIVTTPQDAIDFINQNFGKDPKFCYSAAQMRMLFKSMYSNGIVPANATAPTTNSIPDLLGDAFRVSPAENGLNVNINPGKAWINGWYYMSDDIITKKITAGFITDIVIQLNEAPSDNSIKIISKTRAIGSEPNLIRNNNIYELLLASIEVDSSATSVSLDNIEDQRLNRKPASDGNPICYISATTQITKDCTTINHSNISIVQFYGGGMDKVIEGRTSTYMLLRKIGTTVYVTMPQTRMMLHYDNGKLAQLPKDFFPKSSVKFNMSSIARCEINRDGEINLVIESSNSAVVGQNILYQEVKFSYEAAEPSIPDDITINIGSKWLNGTEIIGDTWEGFIVDAQKYDCYFNTNTCDVYRYDDNNNTNQIWVKMGNIKGHDEDGKVKKYGVRRALTQSSPTLERVWNSVGLVANVAHGNESKPQNDFDNIYPWSNMRECNISVVSGKIRVNAYKGEPTFKLDGSNGQVAVEIPKFYMPPARPGDGYEYWGVSEFKIGGWRVSPAFLDENGKEIDKIYVAKYTASLDNSSDTQKLISKQYAPSLTSATIGYFRVAARTTDSKCQLIDLGYLDVLQTLFTVEFATLNSQSVFTGAVDLKIGTTIHPVISEQTTNRIVISNDDFSVLEPYFTESISLVLGIGTTINKADVVRDLAIVGTGKYDDNNTILYLADYGAEDYASINVDTGYFVNIMGWATGSNTYNNTNGKSGFEYRGIDNPYGNIAQFIDGINFINNYAKVFDNPSEYSNDFNAENARELGYRISTINGYVKELGYDTNFPHIRLPISANGSTTTYFCDYVTTAINYPTANTNITFGMSTSVTNDYSQSGIWYINTQLANNNNNFHTGARQMWKGD